MNLIDLELYKWKWFHDIHLNKKSVAKQKRLSAGHRMYWKEFGAFISTMPRQSGKTTMLVNLGKMFKNKNPSEQCIIVCSRDSMKHAVMSNNSSLSKNEVCTVYELETLLKTKFFVPQDVNLMVDEYTYIGEESLDRILSNPWKTVTMVGTLR